MDGLRLKNVILENSLTGLEALEEVMELITKFTQEGPRNHPKESSKMEYLHRAVIDNKWALHARSQAKAEDPLDFQKVFTN